jgi:spermidine synthase
MACGGEDSLSTAPALLYSCRSEHHDVFVYQSGTTRYLTFESGAWACNQTAIDVEDSRYLVGDYRHALVAAAAIHGVPTRVLCLGVGGGAIPMAVREAFPATTVDAVDIDADVIGIARDWFGLAGNDDGGLLRVHTADARDFLRRACAEGRRWDVILQDVFDQHYIPAHLMTVEFYRELTAVLDEGGLVAINSFAQGQLYERELATYAEVFGGLFEISAGDHNRVVVAYPMAMPGDTGIYTNLRSHGDGLMRVGISVEAMAAQFRPAPWPPEDIRPLTDEDRRCSNLARLRRSAAGCVSDGE